MLDMPKQNGFGRKWAEGWGLSKGPCLYDSNGQLNVSSLKDKNCQQLFATDGSATIYVVEPSSWTVVKELQVKNGAREVRMLNDIEIIRDLKTGDWLPYIFANIYLTSKIVLIDLRTGEQVH